jgi:hypothetical protein
MKRFLICILALVSLFLLPMAAPADQVDVTLTGVGGVNNGQYYIAPYYLTVNGISNVYAFCVDFNHESYLNTSWLANTTTYSGSFDLTYLKNPMAYLEMGYLASIYNNGGNQVSIQQAIWNFSGGHYADSDTLYYVTLAQNNYGTFNGSGWTILTDTRGTAQEFLVHQSVPEPGTMMLLGIGMVGIVPFIKKRVKKN